MFNHLLTGIKKNNKNIHILNIRGFSFGSSSHPIELSNFSYIMFEKYFYIYLNIKYNEGEPSYLLNDKINKNKLNQNKIIFDMSGIGFKKDWINVQIGKGREKWGAGENIELALSNNSDPYNYFKLFSNYGNVRVNYLHGSLESLPNNINRYLTAKGIEWSNKKSILIALSETIIYSGTNRNLDISYLNPIGSHLEVELNNRLNSNVIGNTNAVWQIHTEFLFKKKIRFSLNFLIDEFVIDPDIEIGKENGTAYSTRLSYSLMNTQKHLITSYLQNIKIGTPTFRHGNGFNNFVNNSSPLGWKKGSDSKEFTFGLIYSNKNSTLFEIKFGSLLSGDENILRRNYEPYNDYLKGPFPSGIVHENLFLNFDYQWIVRDNFVLSSLINLTNKNNNEIIIGLSIILD